MIRSIVMRLPLQNKSDRPAAAVLVIDRSLDEQGQLGSILLNGGFTVIAATTTAAAIDAITQQCIDLVLLDATVPAFKDLEFLELLREDLKWTTLPVIVLADNHDLHRISSMARLGISLCLAKTPDVLAQLPVFIRETLNPA